MSLTDKLEEKGINISSLNPIEKETYFKMLETVQKSQLTPEKLREYITYMREAVERELVKEPEFNYIFIFKVPNRNQIMLKARLFNYLLLESFVLSPEKAEKQLDEMINGLIK